MFVFGEVDWLTVAIAGVTDRQQRATHAATFNE